MLNAQTEPSDTLKKVSADTLPPIEEEGSIEEKISYFAEDSTVGTPASGRVVLYGKARVIYGSMNMEADFMEIDYTKNIVKAYGKTDSLGRKSGMPTFKEGAETMEADTIKYNLKTKKGKIYNALTRQGELLVIGSEIKKDSNDVVYFKDMKCLPCNEADARTAFRATKAKVIPDDKIVTGPMYLEIGGVPTPLGLPFGYFPNSKKQHNGLLLPTFGNSPGMGFNLRQGGYYWGINDKTNMIIRGDIYTNGSWMLGTTNNYNILYKASGRVGLSYSQFNIGDKDIPQEYRKEKAYSVEWVHLQDNKSDPSIRFSSNVNFRKNQSFNRLNAVNSGQFLQNVFQSNVNFTKTFRLSSLSLNARHDQNAQTGDMNIMFPELTFNVNRFYPFKRENAVVQNVFDKIQIYYLGEARSTLSGKDSSIFRDSPLDKIRYGVKHTLPVSTNFNILKYITATPQLNFTAFMYTQSTRREYMMVNDIRDTVVTNTVKEFTGAYDANFFTAFNTQVYFDYLFRKGKVKQIRHLMIPTVTYNYRPDFGAPSYGYWRNVQRDSLGNLQRYSIFENSIFGGPAPGEQNAVSLNLNNNFEAKLKQRSDTGISYKKVTLLQGLGLNTGYNFAADSFKMNAIGISARTILFRYFDVVANSRFDPYKYDHNSNRVVNQYMFSYDGRLARLVDVNLTLSTSLGSNMLEAIRKTRQANDMTNGAEKGADPANLSPQENLPWNLRLTYIVGMVNVNDRRLQPTQTMNFSGDIMPTKFWKLGITSGFDFNTQKLSYTSINIYRDLKCWEARIDWIPFGVRKSYALAINLKTAMLSELRVSRQRQWFDTFQ